MVELDVNAIQDSQRALTIIFILLILATNGLLLFIIIRRSPRFMFKPKTAILTSLAIGDLLLALYPLVVEARTAFDDSSGLSCSTVRLATVYWSFLLPFVHAVGLMALALEHVMRHRSVEQTGNFPNSSKQLLVSLLYSGVPWILGLVVVLPLELYGFNFSVCSFESTPSTSLLRAQVWVPITAPASIALMVCIVVICRRRQGCGGQRAIALSTTQPPPQPYNGYVDNQSVTTGAYGNQYPQHDPGNQYPQQYPGNQYPQQYPGNQYPQQYPGNQYPQQYPGNQYPQQYPGNQYPQQYPGNQYPGNPIPVVYSSEPTSQTSDVSAERSAMLGSAIVHFVCVMPLASFYLGYSLNPNNDHNLSLVAFTTFNLGFTWLLTLRSVITPLIWGACNSGNSLR